MNPTDKRPDQPDHTSGTQARGKRPYRKPEFVREQLFETMALACGKTNPSIGQCKSVKKNS